MNEQNVSLIVAASENDVIGYQGELPWHISADLKRFRRLTSGHHIIMGRKTFESIGRLLPDRTTVIVTRNPNFYFAGAKIADSLNTALKIAASDSEPFITGGAEIYANALPHIHTIHLTRVHTEIEGDTFLPDIEWKLWQLESSQRHSADERNQFDFSFQVFRRRKQH